MTSEHRHFISQAIEHIVQGVDPTLHRWYSEEELAANLRASFAQDLVRVTDTDLASGFAGVCPVEGAEPNDYLNVFAPYSAGTVLLDMRFKGLDMAVRHDPPREPRGVSRGASQWPRRYRRVLLGAAR